MDCMRIIKFKSIHTIKLKLNKIGVKVGRYLPGLCGSGAPNILALLTPLNILF